MAGYRWMLAARQRPRVERTLDTWRRRRGEGQVRSSDDWLTEFVAPGRSFLDVGGMWGVDGEVAIRAAELAATPVTLLDFWTTETFESSREARAPDVRFVQGAVEDPANVATIGRIDRVWCWGVFYHLPAPGDLFAALRRITSDRLLLEGRTIPEVPGLPQAAVYWPYMPRGAASAFTQRRFFPEATQLSIDAEFAEELQGANNFWGMSPTAVVALARTYGFRCLRVARSPKGPQRHIFELEPVPVSHLWDFGGPIE